MIPIKENTACTIAHTDSIPIQQLTPVFFGHSLVTDRNFFGHKNLSQIGHNAFRQMTDMSQRKKQVNTIKHNRQSHRLSGGQSAITAN